MRLGYRALLVVVWVVSFGSDVLAQVSLRIGTNVELSRPSSSQDAYSYETGDLVEGSFDSAYVIQYTGRQDQINTNTYGTLPGASLHVRVAWPITQRLSILTGTSVRFEAITFSTRYSSEFTAIPGLRRDTVPYRPPLKNDINLYGQPCRSEVYTGRGGQGQFRNVYLGVPLSVEFAAIPKYLWVSLGGHVEAPLYSSYPGREVTYNFETIDGVISCTKFVNEVKNTSGRYTRNLQYGGHLGLRLAINKNTQLTAEATGQFTSVFVDPYLQADGPTYDVRNEESREYQRLDYRPQRLAIGLMWTIVGPKHAGVDL